MPEEAFLRQVQETYESGRALDAWRDGRWNEIARGTSIGNCRLARTAPITTDRVRLRITAAPVCPAISEVGLFAEPGQ